MAFSEDNNKPIAVLISCMDRRLDEMIDNQIDYYKGRGYEVKVFRTAGGNADPIESELREIAGTGRLEVLFAVPHIDCGWVKAAAQVLYVGAEASQELVNEMDKVFAGLEVTEEDKKDLNSLQAKMERYLSNYLNNGLREIVGPKVEIEMRMPDARLFDKERKDEPHEHHLIFVEPSDLKTTDLIKGLEGQGITGIEPWEIYDLRGNVKSLLPSAEVAVKFLELADHQIFVFGRGNDASKANEVKAELQKAPFMANANIRVITLNGTAKMPLASAH